jgi:hypothetical protein
VISFHIFSFVLHLILQVKIKIRKVTQGTYLQKPIEKIKVVFCYIVPLLSFNFLYSVFTGMLKYLLFRCY